MPSRESRNHIGRNMASPLRKSPVPAGAGIRGTLRVVAGSRLFRPAGTGLTLLFLAAAPLAAQRHCLVQPKAPVLFRQPGGPFGVVVTPNATGYGTPMMVGYVAPLSPDSETASWSRSNRWWRDSTWGGNVTSLCWSPDRRLLFVGTSSRGADGGLWALDLRQRTARRLAPTPFTVRGAAAYRTTIRSMDAARKRLLFRLTVESEAAEKPTTIESAVAFPE